MGPASLARLLILLLFTNSPLAVKGDGDGTTLPSLYEYYTEGGVSEGLETQHETFTLNGRNITLLSGAIHYFRVPPAYWRDRLRKLRACGLNAVETYVPWNLHNPTPDEFDFGEGGTSWSPFLDISTFLRVAREEDLLVILRPGPYICAEWEFGGLPSWLLRDPNMKVRTSYEGYTKYVRHFFDRLMSLVAPLHFVHGGPIVALQLENEYGALHVDDKPYLQFLKETMESHGIKGLFFTSDSPLATGASGALPGVLQTANFQNQPELELNALKALQPDTPSMVMEYWTGWFDHWTEQHHTRTTAEYADILERILQFPASVNLYMFHGGSNWGFMNGANSQSRFPTYQPDVSSYDYDAPLNEAGDYTEKYEVTRQLVKKYNPILTSLPSPPPESTKVAWSSIPLEEKLSLDELVMQLGEKEKVKNKNTLPMEMLPVNNYSGQSYGLILYRQKSINIPEKAVLKIHGHVRDVGMVLLNGKRQTPELLSADQFHDFGYWEKENASIELSCGLPSTQTLDILIENWGRVNYGRQDDFVQFKGIVNGPVTLDDNKLNDWEIYTFQFHENWLKRLNGWKSIQNKQETLDSPTLFRAQLVVDEPTDSWLDMRGWSKGIVFINGFALGRYFHLGPTHSLYLPAPLLKSGNNEVLIFEYFTANSEIVFSDTPLLSN